MLKAKSSQLSFCKEFPKVMDSKSKMTTADKAYDSKKNHRPTVRWSLKVAFFSGL